MRRERSQGKRAQSASSAGTLFIVGVPIGHPDDLTIRGLATLRQVDLIAAKNPQATHVLLAHHGIHTTITTYDRNNAADKVPLLLDRLKHGDQVGLVSDCGMPVVYDPGRLLIAAASKAQIPVTVIPGTSAVVAAAALAGMDGNAFIFDGRWTGGTKTLTTRLHLLRSEPRTMIFFPPAQNLRQFLALLQRTLGNRKVMVAIDMTRSTEQILRGRVQELLSNKSNHDSTSHVVLVVEGARLRRKNSVKQSQ
ncbi:MAG: SAM-dependent methyltransferase [Nitrospira sp.]|jgi:16S rRNA (cytidine1402-2'-O)-methyltransferase|nr:SAM-dependent methyltransferase [Nitrospira sp.]